MQGRSRIFDDAARVAGGAMGTFAGIRREVETLVRHQMERMLAGMDLVTRDEFETVREMAIKARTEQERLEERVIALESLLAEPKGKKPARPTSTSPDVADGADDGE